MQRAIGRQLVAYGDGERRVDADADTDSDADHTPRPSRRCPGRPDDAQADQADQAT
jgi:hypothetical protein